MTKKTFTLIAALAAFAVLPDLAAASDDTGYNAVADGGYKALTCAEARQAAWLERQVEMTDGDTSPQVPVPHECSADAFRIAAAADEAN